MKFRKETIFSFYICFCLFVFQVFSLSPSRQKKNQKQNVICYSGVHNVWKITGSFILSPSNVGGFWFCFSKLLSVITYRPTDVFYICGLPTHLGLSFFVFLAIYIYIQSSNVTCFPDPDFCNFLLCINASFRKKKSIYVLLFFLIPNSSKILFKFGKWRIECASALNSVLTDKSKSVSCSKDWSRFYVVIITSNVFYAGSF